MRHYLTAATLTDARQLDQVSHVTLNEAIARFDPFIYPLARPTGSSCWFPLSFVSTLIRINGF